MEQSLCFAMKSNILTAAFTSALFRGTGGMLWFLFLISCHLQAQNLVPNPSFETYTDCPQAPVPYAPPDFLALAAPWYTPTHASPDYYTACSTVPSAVRTPNNSSSGFQFPRTGTAMVGLIVTVDTITYRNVPNPVREYIQVPLIRPLTTGKWYRISFYVNLANQANDASSRIGALLSTGEVRNNNLYQNYPPLISRAPQVKNPKDDFKTDTLLWSKICGIVQADSAYAFLTIGNFYDNRNTGYIRQSRPPQQGGNRTIDMAYYFIDDVSVEEANQEEVNFDIDSSYSVCIGDTLLLNVKQPAASGNFTWYVDYGLQGEQKIGTGNSISRVVAKEEIVQVIGQRDGCSLYKNLEVALLPSPAFPFTSSQNLCEGDTVILKPDAPDVQFVSGGNMSDHVSIYSSGRYVVEIVKENGCTVRDTLTFHPCTPEVPVIPNLVTANGDQYNDVFKINTKNVKEQLLHIYDRWGALVYFSDTGMWDPLAGNFPVSDGLYFYHFIITGHDGNQKQYRGWLEVCSGK
jgi:gliding motility-associated-like protein